MEGKRLKNILITLFVIAVLLAGFWFGTGFMKERQSRKDDIETISDLKNVLKMEPSLDGAEEVEELPSDSDETEDMTDESEDSVEEVENASEVTEVPPADRPKTQRYVTGEHTVRKGESFSLITGFYWEDIFLWPDLYIRNSMRSDDPDLIYPNEIITIYNRLGRGNNFSENETSEILEAYLEVYRIYKKLGDSKNNSVWSLLWCAARYDHSFLDVYADRIDPEDRAMAQKYIDEQGFLD